MEPRVKQTTSHSFGRGLVFPLARPVIPQQDKANTYREWVELGSLERSGRLEKLINGIGPKDETGGVATALRQQGLQARDYTYVVTAGSISGPPRDRTAQRVMEFVHRRLVKFVKANDGIHTKVSDIPDDEKYVWGAIMKAAVTDFRKYIGVPNAEELKIDS